MPKIRYTKTGAGPEPQHNFRIGKVANVSTDRATELVEAGAAVIIAPGVEKAKARQAAKETR